MKQKVDEQKSERGQSKKKLKIRSGRKVDKKK